MLSLVRVGKEWTSPAFLHTDNHLLKIDALSCQVGKEWASPMVDVFTIRGGEKTGRPSCSPPQLLTTKHHFYFGLSDKTMGWPSFSTKQILTITYYEKIYGWGVGG